MQNRYTGRIATVSSDGRYGFIGLATVTKSDGSSHALATAKDVFIHQDECSFTLRKDVEISFTVEEDTTRDGAYRAAAVSEVVHGELMLADVGPGTDLVDTRTLYVPPSPAQSMRMKPVDPDTLEGVVRNRPMPLVPRSGRIDDALAASREIIKRVFPQFDAISAENGGDLADESFDEVIRAAVEDHRSIGMNAQADLMMRQANTYKGLRAVLRDEDYLLTPQTIIPVQYLPDLFMAVPVWYFWADENVDRESKALQRAEDPEVHPKIAEICELVPGQRWADTFQMYNRRLRTLADYEGDIIPPRIVARMRKLAPLFDHLVIMTPYHDVVGRDWTDAKWLRSIDPYVVGFLKGIPFMFVVGRFSDSGIFPLHSELVADTIAFLRENVLKLRGFNRVKPYWFRADGARSHVGHDRHGDYLIEHTRELLGAFDRDELFDWLRGASPQLPATQS